MAQPGMLTVTGQVQTRAAIQTQSGLAGVLQLHFLFLLFSEEDCVTVQDLAAPASWGVVAQTLVAQPLGAQPLVRQGLLRERCLGQQIPSHPPVGAC